jgi:hypothetical protein
MRVRVGAVDEKSRGLRVPARVGVFLLSVALVAAIALGAAPSRASATTSTGSNLPYDRGTLGGSSTYITASSSASTLAAAIVADPSTLTGATFVDRPNGGNPTATANTGFGSRIVVLAGTNMAVLSTGDATDANTVQTQSSGGDFGTPSVADNSPDTVVRGGHDVTVLQLNVVVPAYADCLGLDVNYLSSDAPVVSVGSVIDDDYIDGFIAELDPATPWSIAGQQPAASGQYSASQAAPADFAVTSQDDFLDANLMLAPGQGYADAQNIFYANGTPYSAGTGWLGAFRPVTPGTHVVDLSIFDRGDQHVDSTVLLDGLSFFHASPGSPAGADCLTGLEGLPAATAPQVVLTTPKAGGTVAQKPSFSGMFGTNYQDLPKVTLDVYKGEQATGTPIETLAAIDGSGTWSATSPRSLALGTYTAVAHQSNLSGQLGSSETHTFHVERGTKTTITCAPHSVPAGTASKCVVTVVDIASGHASTPAGKVTFSANAPGRFSDAGMCVLAAGKCNVKFTPSSVGSRTDTITATYLGKSPHAGSSGLYDVHVASSLRQRDR